VLYVNAGHLNMLIVLSSTKVTVKLDLFDQSLKISPSKYFQN